MQQIGERFRFATQLSAVLLARHLPLQRLDEQVVAGREVLVQQVHGLGHHFVVFVVQKVLQNNPPAQSTFSQTKLSREQHGKHTVFIGLVEMVYVDLGSEQLESAQDLVRYAPTD